MHKSVGLISKAIEVGLYIAFLVYLGKLETIGCACALNWRRKFIIAYVAIALAWTLAAMVNKTFNNVYLFIILVLFRIAFIIITVQYINILKQDKCECSEHLTRDILYYYAWIAIILAAITLSMIVWAFATAYTR